MKQYGITKKKQLGDYGADWIVGPRRQKEFKRVDRKRARRQSKEVVVMEVDEYEEQMTSMRSCGLTGQAIGPSSRGLRVRIPPGA